MEPTKAAVIAGTDVTAVPADELARLRRSAPGFVFQDYNLIDSLISLRSVRASLYSQHRGGYVGVVGVAVVCGAVVTASLNALQLAAGARLSSGAPHEAARWNAMVDLMTSFNGPVVGMGP